MASGFGKTEIVQLLIEKGIDINKTNIFRKNALHLAIQEGETEVVKLLIEKGIDINQTDRDGRNALDLASERGNT